MWDISRKGMLDLRCVFKPKELKQSASEFHPMNYEYDAYRLTQAINEAYIDQIKQNKHMRHPFKHFSVRCPVFMNPEVIENVITEFQNAGWNITLSEDNTYILVTI